MIDATPKPAIRKARKGFFILFGRPGTGKSFRAGKCFSRKTCAILSAPNNQHFYESWLDTPEGLASGKTRAKRTIVLDRYVLTDTDRDKPYVVPDAAGDPTALPQKMLLERILEGVVKRQVREFTAGQPLTYENYIIDEGGTFWMRCFEEIIPNVRTNDGRLDTMRAHSVGAAWSVWISDLFRQVTNAGANVCMIAHDREPEPEKGKKGGARFFNQAVMKQLTADADGALLVEMVDQGKGGIEFDPNMTAAQTMAAMATANAAKNRPAERLLRLHASEDWEAKLRGLHDSMFDQIRRMELEDVLPLAGWAP